jgi:hypothetical protein
MKAIAAALFIAAEMMAAAALAPTAKACAYVCYTDSQGEHCDYEPAGCENGSDTN